MELTVSNLAETLHHLVRWQNVAIHLPHVTSTHIARIERDFPHNTGLQLISMFTEWLDKCPQASWYDVLQALVKAGEINLNLLTISTKNSGKVSENQFHLNIHLVLTLL